MTYKEFQTQMARLISIFGAGMYPNERLDLIWIGVSNCPLNVFKKIVDNFVADAKSAPNRQAFIDSLRAFQSQIENENEQRIKKLKENFDCFRCNNTGGIQAIHRENKFKYGFKCICEIGALKDYNYPQWSDEYYDKFDPGSSDRKNIINSRKFEIDQLEKDERFSIKTE